MDDLSPLAKLWVLAVTFVCAPLALLGVILGYLLGPTNGECRKRKPATRRGDLTTWDATTTWCPLTTH